ncbi:hypothetical protein CyaNS01_02404 [Cyanobium sp. NS01]|nr:hypothetical protein CyaNS01_02404 [Cyanobium sp. NS01]
MSRPAWRSAMTNLASKASFISSFLVKDGQLQQCLLACGGILVWERKLSRSCGSPRS